MTAGPRDTARDKLRIDKWLWHARFFRTRALAAELAGSGRLRINSERSSRPSHQVRPGDVLTFPQGDRIRVIRIEALSARRGPAAEAQALYTDLDPPAATSALTLAPTGLAQRDPGAGRPTKLQRRKTCALRRRDP